MGLLKCTGTTKNYKELNYMLKTYKEERRLEVFNTQKTRRREQEDIPQRKRGIIKDNVSLRSV